jgi:hypothetical protein
MQFIRKWLAPVLVLMGLAALFALTGCKRA